MDSVGSILAFNYFKTMLTSYTCLCWSPWENS